MRLFLKNVNFDGEKWQFFAILEANFEKVLITAYCEVHFGFCNVKTPLKVL